ncbi:MAG: siphovirus Gp157 family protein [Patescibacteria group bacterium]|nr:siphovirus Gp157 family protein [Patescibacteria group bacterium]
MTMLPALYQLTAEHAAILDQLEGFDEQTIADTLEGSNLPALIGEKAQALEYIARAAVQHVPAIDAEIARLQELKASRERKADGVRAYLKRCMEQGGIDKIECPMFKVSIQKNPPSVDILNPIAIPEEFMAYKPAPAPTVDKKKVADALKAGQELSWAALKQSTRLVIK